MHAMFSKEDDVSLGRTFEMVPEWDPETREIMNKELCRSNVRYKQERPLAATAAVYAQCVLVRIMPQPGRRKVCLEPG